MDAQKLVLVIQFRGRIVLLISNCGNTSGSIPSLENDPEYVLRAVKEGFNCKVDIWFGRKSEDDLEQFYTGTNGLEFPVNSDFLSTTGLWLRPMNMIAWDMAGRFWSHCNVVDDIGSESMRSYASNGIEWVQDARFIPYDVEKTIFSWTEDSNPYSYLSMSKSMGICCNKIKKESDRLLRFMRD